MITTASPTLNHRQVLGYGTGSIGVSILTTVPPLLLLYFLTDVCGVPPALAGIGLFLPQLLEFVATPAVGYLSDRRHSLSGSRRPFLLVGSVASALAMALLFLSPPLTTSSAALAYTSGIYALVVLAGTVFAVPHLAMSAEMTSDAALRSRIVGTRMGFVMVGILVSGALAQPIALAFGGGKVGYSLLSLVLGAICGLTMLVAWRATRTIHTAPTVQPTASLVTSLKVVWVDQDFRVLSLSYIAQIVGISCGLGAWPYYADHVLRDPSAVSWLFGLVMVCTILSLPAWVWACGRFGRARCYLAGTLMSIFGAVGVFGLGDASAGWVPLSIALAALGVGVGALQFVPFAMVADLAEQRHREGLAVTGTLTAVWAVVEKVGFALGALVLGLLLSAYGYQEAKEGVAVVQNTRALEGILLAPSLLPAAFYALSMLMLLAIPRWRQQLKSVLVDTA